MTPSSLARWFEAHWQGRSPAILLLLPLSWLFGFAVSLRRWYWLAGPGRPRRLGVPVIVVGNITVGGTGKPPVVDWLAGVCRAAGCAPGIVSRGYGGRKRSTPHLVQPDDDALEVGDGLFGHKSLDNQIVARGDHVKDQGQILTKAHSG